MAVKRPTAKKKTATKKAAPAKKTVAKKAVKAAAKKAPAKSASTKATPNVMTLRHIAAEIANARELPKKQAEEMLGEFVEHIRQNLKKGKKVRINGLGVMEVRKRAARMGRNPATGEAIKIKASKKVAFRVAKDLKEAVL